MRNTPILFCAVGISYNEIALRRNGGILVKSVKHAL